MSFESDVFKRSKPDFLKLKKFGFKERRGGLSYSKDFLNNTFRADIFINTDGKVKGKVIDLETGDEYSAFRFESRTGEFIGSVREAYSDILFRIKESCFTLLPFLFEQSNRLSERIYSTYGDEPDYPFENFPNYGVFRDSSNGKWFGLIMNISKDKLTKNKSDSGIAIEILNIKVNPEKLPTLLGEEGFYPCYHISRGNWVSVILDGTVGDERIMELIDESRVLTSSKKPAFSGNRNKWIVPANPKYYNIEDDFASGEPVLWKQGRGIKVNDIVYLYVGSPVSAILYKCKVIEIEIPYKYSDENIKMTKAMKMEVLKTYDKSVCTIQKLREFGVTTVRAPRYMPEELEKTLNTIS